MAPKKTKLTGEQWLALSDADRLLVVAADQPTALAVDMVQKKRDKLKAALPPVAAAADAPVTGAMVKALIEQNAALISALSLSKTSAAGTSEKLRVGNPPTFEEKTMDKAQYVMWRELYTAWSTTHRDVPDSVKAGLLIPVIKSVTMLGHIRARMPAEQWTSLETTDADGVVTKSGLSRILGLMDDLLQKERTVKQFEALAQYLQLKRGQTKMTDYLATFESRKQQLELHGLSLPSSVVNLMLVSQAEITNKTQLGNILQWMQTEQERVGADQPVDHEKLRQQLRALGAAYEAVPDLLSGPGKSKEAVALAAAKAEVVALKKAHAGEMALWGEKKGAKKGLKKGEQQKQTHGLGKGPSSGKPGATGAKLVCSGCKREGHTVERCWNAHPELKPQWLQAKHTVKP